MTDEIDSINIPIENIIVVIRRDDYGTTLLCVASADDPYVEIDVPNYLEVTSSRFGPIRTALDNGKYFVLGYHDDYEVSYRGVLIKIRPKMVFDITVDRKNGQHKAPWLAHDGKTRCEEWFHITSQYAKKE